LVIFAELPPVAGCGPPARASTQSLDVVDHRVRLHQGHIKRLARPAEVFARFGDVIRSRRGFSASPHELLHRDEEAGDARGETREHQREGTAQEHLEARMMRERDRLGSNRDGDRRAELEQFIGER